jgi:processive 1,2-diacylglycerol beta-glucosyltransferase
MKKVLFLPLFQMPSGHHRVADALMNSLIDENHNVRCKKVDFLSYWNKSIEKLVSTTYLKWIEWFPGTYDWIYKHTMYSQDRKNREDSSTPAFLFQYLMLKMIREEKPDVIVCTHSFPSFIINHLKRIGKIDVPVVNVYTDFFINDVWGKSGIDYHLVNDRSMKQELINRFHVPEDRITITGIPVNEESLTVLSPDPHTKKHILVSGGSIGLGRIKELLVQIKEDSLYRYTVLCGKNQRLYDDINSWGVDHIQPMNYIQTQSEMNALYEEVDAIITKPGGITISEALKKRIPIFVHSALPGQEQINLKKLVEEKLVVLLTEEIAFEEQITSILENDWKRNVLIGKMDSFESKKEKNAFEVVLELVQPSSFLKVRHT